MGSRVRMPGSGITAMLWAHIASSEPWYYITFTHEIKRDGRGRTAMSLVGYSDMNR